MDHEQIKAQLLTLPDVTAWHELSALFERTVVELRPAWEWPLLACRAVGGDETVAAPGGAALACIMLSIILVDDMLDRDPRGAHVQYGEATTANLACALEAAAFRLVADAPLDAARRLAVLQSLSAMTLGTAYGQSLDVQNLRGEEAYWRVVAAKSTPFYGALLQVGALLGDAPPAVAEQLRELGVLCGEIIQLHDDLIDALQTPANADWTQGRNNLLLLYAQTAAHDERERFGELLRLGDERQALHEAQEILLRCGAVSYCAYHIVSRYRRAQQLLADTPLAQPALMRDLLQRQVRPLAALLRKVDAEIPPELDDL